MADLLRAPLRTPVAVVLWILVGLTCTAVWRLAGGGGYWPAWVWVGGWGVVGAIAVVRAAWTLRRTRSRWAVAHLGLAAVASSVVTLVWALTGGGPWIGWTLLGISVAVSLHAVLAYADRLPPRPRERQLAARIDQLIAGNRGALESHVALMRRLERDLHDGAQSRLVALNVLLGRAEDRLAAGAPDAGDLVHLARIEAKAAISELRDLARGIAPPLLDERGLEVAVEALALRSPVPVEIRGQLSERPPRAVETAAYFVIAEALTNVAKHGAGARARVDLDDHGEHLVLRVADDGPGGADPSGSGLVGLRHRVEALDGILTVGPGPQGGTEIRAELPCGS